MMRVAKTTFGVAAVLGSLLFSGASAFGAAAPAGGTIKVWATPANGGGGGGSIVITGAIGDYGKSAKVKSADKSVQNTRLVLKKGTILIDTTQVQATLQKVAAPPADLSNVTCSGSAIASDVPVPIVSGTKAYAGITGSVTVTVSFAFVLPLTNGKCDTNTNANPVAQYGSIIGSGTVSFS